jgi:hypothetical protein
MHSFVHVELGFLSGLFHAPIMRQDPSGVPEVRLGDVNARKTGFGHF